MKQKDGGPAFASPQFAVPDTLREEHIMLLRSLCGMSMRQYYKAKAMQGELASQSEDTGEYTEAAFPSLARRAGLIADAMLAEDIEHATRQED